MKSNSGKFITCNQLCVQIVKKEMVVMKVFINFICFISFVFLLSCANERKEELLDEADALAVEHPDSALLKLGEIEKPEKMTGELQARYAIVMTKALNIKGVPFKSDSLIKIALQYYDKGDLCMKAKSFFYAASVYSSMDSIQKATLYFKKAADLLPNFNETRLTGLTYYSLGQINRVNGLPNLALPLFQKALSYYVKLDRKDELGMGLQEIGKLYVEMNQFEKADSCFKAALSIAPSIDLEWQTTIYHNSGVFYQVLGRYEKADSCFKQALLRDVRVQGRLRTLALLATNYDKQGKADLADSLWKHALKIESCETRKYIYDQLLTKALDKKDLPSISEYILKYKECADSASKLRKTKDIAEIQMKYDNDVLYYQNKNYKWKFISLTLMGIVAFCGFIYIHRRYRRRAKKSLTLKDQELSKNKVEKTKLLLENNMRKRTIFSLQQKLEVNKKHPTIDTYLFSVPVQPNEYENIVQWFSILYPKLVMVLSKFSLSDYEKVICILSCLDMSEGETEKLLGKNYEALKKARTRIKKTMEIDRKTKLNDFIKDLIAKEC